MGRKLGDACQLVQVPDDAGSVSGSAHNDAEGCGGSQAGHGLRVPIQRLGGTRQAKKKATVKGDANLVTSHNTVFRTNYLFHRVCLNCRKGIRDGIVSFPLAYEGCELG